jgi:fluoride exporter
VRPLLLVCLGGALGSGARYLVGLAMTRLASPGFPWGTLLVNVLGCFAIELVVQAGSKANLSPLAVLTLTTGVMGGFTTYSAFNNQLLTLARAGTWPPLALYLTLTLTGCAAAGLLGIAAGQALWNR